MRRYSVASARAKTQLKRALSAKCKDVRLRRLKQVLDLKILDRAEEQSRLLLNLAFAELHALAFACSPHFKTHIAKVSSHQNDARIADMCSLLLQAASFSIATMTNRNKHTILHLAAMRGHASTCGEILRCPSRANFLLQARDVYGMNAADMAACGGHDELASRSSSCRDCSMHEPQRFVLTLVSTSLPRREMLPRAAKFRVKVSIIRASNLRPADLSLIGQSKSDPYCICRLAGRPETQVRTATIMKTQQSWG
eukprot:g33292.t1